MICGDRSAALLTVVDPWVISAFNRCYQIELAIASVEITAAILNLRTVDGLRTTVGGQHVCATEPAGAEYAAAGAEYSAAGAVEGAVI